MLTSAAIAQALSKQPLAYVKQSLPSARARKAIIAVLIVAQMSLSAGCVRLPRRNVTSNTTSTQITINLNTASIEELESLPGIGEAIAERIVAHREQYGPFRRPEHLMMVQGISDQKFRAIRSKIRAE